MASFAKLTPKPVQLQLSNALSAPGEPLDMMASEIMCMFGADGLLVVWHHGAERVTLFADDASDAEAQREMLRCAACAAISGVENTWLVADSTCGEILIAPVAVDHGLVTITALFTQSGMAADGYAHDVAARMLPLLRPFFRLWSERFKADLSLRGLTAAVNRSDIGIALVARSGKLIFANSACEALMAEGDGIKRAGPIICGASLADTLRLQATIDHVVAAGAAMGSGRSITAPVLAIARGGRRPLLATVVLGDDLPDEPNARVAVVYFFDPDANLQPMLEPVCKLYGLSPVEAKLTCLLAGGISLAEAAERMHVRELTARSYLKQIFMKTDTNRQAELACLMLKSSVRMAPACRANLV